MYGEYRGATPEGKLKTILGRLHGGPTSHNYVVSVENVVVGYLSIWEGYNPQEMEVGEPVVEWGFLDPEYKRLEGILQTKVVALLPTLKDGWW